MTHEDLVWRDFTATGPDRAWFTDGTISEGNETTGWQMSNTSVADARQRHTILPTGSGSIQ